MTSPALARARFQTPATVPSTTRVGRKIPLLCTTTSALRFRRESVGSQVNTWHAIGQRAPSNVLALSNFRDPGVNVMSLGQPLR